MHDLYSKFSTQIHIISYTDARLIIFDVAVHMLSNMAGANTLASQLSSIYEMIVWSSVSYS